MKNLLIYVSPHKKFTTEDDTLCKIQIDNSLGLGQKSEDIMLATNFPYSYNGVSSIVIPDLYYEFDLAASKLPAMIYLIEKSIITHSDLYWCHDLDAFELNRIEESDLELERYNLGLVHYTYKPEWCFGSVFFRRGAIGVFKLLDQTIRRNPWKSRNNEKHLTWLIRQGYITQNEFKRMDVTYNIAKRCLATVYREAEKPIRVLHFRPSDPKDRMMPDSALNMFMYGKNRLKLPMMNDRLITIFKHHGIE